MNDYDRSLELWNENEYEAALDIWKLCLAQGMWTEEIVSNIYEAFLIPNESEFVATIVRAWQEFGCGNITSEMAAEVFQTYSIYYLPYDEKKYYVYDVREQILLGKIDFEKKLPEDEDLFSDILLVNPETVLDLLGNVAGREKVNIYCIGEEKKEYESVYCIPEVVDRLEKKITYFANCQEEKEYFLSHSCEYIPKNIRGNAGALEEQEVLQVYLELHEKRKLPQYRDSGNVLLTIGIPSYNRGQRALDNVLHLLESVYDAEIEIVLSDNGSEVQAEQYVEIAKIQDARLKYYRAPENKGFLGNVQKIFEIASGKYVLLCSDEDEVLIGQLHYFLSTLRNREHLGLLRGSRAGSGNPIVYKDAYDEKGDGAFTHIFLANNYMSGSIYRCNERTRELWRELCEKYKENVAFIYYPHMFFDAHIAELYDVCDQKEFLINLGEEEQGQGATIMKYAELECRMQQHTGWREMLDHMEGISILTKCRGYIGICWKLFFLVDMVKERYMDDWENVCRQMAEYCALEYDKIQFLSDEEKKRYQQIVVDRICEYFETFGKGNLNRSLSL